YLARYLAVPRSVFLSAIKQKTFGLELGKLRVAFGFWHAADFFDALGEIRIVHGRFGRRGWWRRGAAGTENGDGYEQGFHVRNSSSRRLARTAYRIYSNCSQNLCISLA